MSLDGLHERLKSFGFTRQEAEIYVFLTAMGPTPARVVARRFNINRMKAYRILKDLEDRGLIQRIVGRPVRFVAASPEDVLRRSIEETRQTLSGLEGDEKLVLEELARIRGQEQDVVEEPRFRIYQGRQQVYDFLGQMGDRVEMEMNLVTTSLDLLRLSLWGMDDRLIELSRGGRRVRLLVPVDESNIGEVEKLAGHFEVRHISMETPMRFALVDDKEILTSVAMDDSMSMTTDDDTALWTNAPSFISAIKIFYDSLWALAPDAETLITSMRTGVEPQEFRALRDRDEYVSAFTSMIRDSSRSVDILVSRTQDLPVGLQDLEKLLLGKEIRVVTSVDESASDDVALVREHVRLRHNQAETDLTLLVVDGRECLLATSDWESMGQAVWSNLEPYVDTMSLVFGDYWRNGKPAQLRLMELSALHNTAEITETLKEALTGHGWSADIPGYLVGSSGATYGFTMSATDQGSGRRLGLNLAIGDDAFKMVIEMSARKLDLGAATLVLASIKPFSEEILRLGVLYGVALIQADDSGSLAQEVLRHLVVTG
jgi:sugar-specific transcriptional regulator TrmB